MGGLRGERLRPGTNANSTGCFALRGSFVKVPVAMFYFLLGLQEVKPGDSSKEEEVALAP